MKEMISRNRDILIASVFALMAAFGMKLPEISFFTEVNGDNELVFIIILTGIFLLSAFGSVFLVKDFISRKNKGTVSLVYCVLSLLIACVFAYVFYQIIMTFYWLTVFVSILFEMSG